MQVATSRQCSGHYIACVKTPPRKGGNGVFDSTTGHLDSRQEYTDTPVGWVAAGILDDDKVRSSLPTQASPSSI